MRRDHVDAVVVGSGPNGLAAAITLARKGCSVLVCEAADTPGGGMRTAELTLPGYLHDICSAIHPLGLGSPFFCTIPLTDLGVEWIHPPIPAAHPLDDGTAAVLHVSVGRTAEGLGRDGAAWEWIFGRLARAWPRIVDDILAPLGRFPRDPIGFATFGLLGLWPATLLTKLAFKTTAARALFGGMAAHSIQSLDAPFTSAVGLMLTSLGHTIGWPFPRGGSQQLANALVAYLQTLGGRIELGRPIRTMDDLPPHDVVLFDTNPHSLVMIAGGRLPEAYRKRLLKYRYGPGVFKIDWALDGPVPWTAPECRQAGTIHLGGTFEEIVASERACTEGAHHARPFILAAQQSLFDTTRAPAGHHTFWTYCHVPNGSVVDMSDSIRRQIERFAPGFSARVIASKCMSAMDYQAYNPNYMGGDINGGIQDIWQLFTRPVARAVPYSTPVRGLYICSSSTPPGGGVHGMCGYHAANAAWRQVLSLRGERGRVRH